MADSTVGLLFRLTADAGSARSEFTSFRNFTKGELNQLSSLFNATFSSIERSAASSFGLAGQTARLFINSLLSIKPATADVAAETKKLDKTIESLSSQTGKTKTEVLNFVKSFNTLETDAKKLRAAIDEFGGRLAVDLLPTLERAGAQLGNVEQKAVGVSGGLASIAAPAGIAAAAVAIVTGATIALTAELFKLAEGAAVTGDSLYKAHLRTQLSIESLSGLRLEAQENKVSFDTVVSSIDRYLKNVDNAALSNKKLAHELSDLGLTAQELRGNPQAAVEGLIRVWNQLPPTADRNQVAITLLGKGGDALIPVLDALKGSMGDVIKRAAELGQLWDLETARQAHDLEVSVADLSAAWDGLKAAIGKQAFEEITIQVERLTKAIRDNRDEVASAAPGIIGWIEISLDSVRRLADLVGGVLVGALALVHTVLTPIINLSFYLTEAINLLWQGIASLFSSKEAAAAARFRGEVEATRVALTDYISTLKLAASLLSGVFGASPFKTTLEDELAYDEQLKQRTAEEKEKARQGRAARLTHDDSAERRKAAQEAAKEAREQAEAELHVIELRTRGAERLYQQETESAQQNYQARVSSLREYVAQEGAAEAQLRDAKLNELSAERTAVEQTITNAAERTKRLADIRDKEEATREAYRRKVEKLEFDAKQKELEAAKGHSTALLDIETTRDKSLIEALRFQAERRIGIATETENAVISVERAGLDRRAAHLTELLNLAGQNIEEQRKVNDDLARLTTERAGFEEEATRRIAHARLADIEALRRYHNELDTLRQSNREGELANAHALLDDLQKSYVTRAALERAQSALEIAAEQDRHSAMLERIKIGREGALAVVNTEGDRLRVEDEYHAKEQAEVGLHNQRMFALRNAGLHATIATNEAQAVIEARNEVATADRDRKAEEAEAKRLNIKAESLFKGKQLDDEQLRISTDAQKRIEDSAAKHRANLEAIYKRYGVTPERVSGLSQDPALSAAAALHDSNLAIISQETKDAVARANAIGAGQASIDEIRATAHNREIAENRRFEAELKGEGRRLTVTRRELIEAQFKLEEGAETIRHDRELTRIADAKKQADKDIQDREKHDAVIRELNRQEEDETDRHDEVMARGTKSKSDALELSDPSSRRSRFGSVYADAFKATKQAAKDASKPISDFKAGLSALAVTAEDAFSRMSAGAGNMTDILSGAFETLVQGLGSTLEAFLVTGDLSGKALAKLLVQTLAHISAQSAVKAVFELAEGYAAAANFDFLAAAEHFTAAKFYGVAAAIAGGAALVARGALGGVMNSAAQSQGAGGSSAGGGSGSGGQDSQPNNQSFNYGSPLSTPASADAQPGSRGSIFARIERLHEEFKRQSARQAATHTAAMLEVRDTLATFKTAGMDEVVVKGLDTTTGRRAAGKAIKEHSDEAPSFNRHLLGNLGFGR